MFNNQQVLSQRSNCMVVHSKTPKGNFYLRATFQVINIGISDTFSKYVCMDCEQKICTFDEFCLMVANVQKQLTAPSLEIDFAEVFIVRRFAHS